MYKSKIKPDFRGFKFEDKEYIVLFDIGDEKVLIYDAEAKFIYDLYKNKLMSPQAPIHFKDFNKTYYLYLEAKREQYQAEHNLYSSYRLVDFSIRDSNKRNSFHKLTTFNVLDTETGTMRHIFPSRFKVVDIYNYREEVSELNKFI
jgi:hypothetical protein